MHVEKPIATVNLKICCGLGLCVVDMGVGEDAVGVGEDAVVAMDCGMGVENGGVRRLVGSAGFTQKSGLPLLPAKETGGTMAICRNCLLCNWLFMH